MSDTSADLKGVRGWLLLLCVSLAVFDPGAVLINVFLVADAAKPYFSKNPTLFRLVLVNGVAVIALAVFSLYAGISLWRRIPGATSIARGYFRAICAYALVAPFLPNLLGEAFKASDETFTITCVNSIFTIIYAGVWYTYLNRSARVKATYGDSA